jgi:hypothetical protein
LLLALCAGGATAEDKWSKVEPLLIDDMPRAWTKLRLADQIEVNGLPMLIYEITGTETLKEAAAATAAAWAKNGWQVTSKPVESGVEITGIKGPWMKHARLMPGKEKGIKGHFSLSDLPGRVAAPSNEPPPVFGKHLRKPTGTVVLNEVRTVDMAGESILTTLVNDYDIEQNSAFYEEAMVSLGWKLGFKRTVRENGNKVLKYVLKDGKEATFTFTREERQTFVVVNWVTR